MFLKYTFWPTHSAYTQCHGRWEVNGTLHKAVTGKKKDKLENTDTSEKLLKINRELKLKRQKEALEAGEKKKGAG